MISERKRDWSAPHGGVVIQARAGEPCQSAPAQPCISLRKERDRDVLARTDLGDLSGLGDDVGAALLANARMRDLDANSVVYFQEDATEYLYILLSGHIRLTYIGEDGFVTLYNIISAGRTFGESGLLDDLPHCDTAATIGAARVMGIEANWIRQEGAAQAAVRQALARLVAQRYRQHMQFTRALYFPSLS
ncbi:Crp/Fnr family transcriptional regulator [Marivita sp. GX14005]|uniref:Crp/Fnr family transcriptional regulator n=1 Tax=Marivita sp. GX14005 TaxID=2942276 RepID=UPI0020194AE7|nr:Crp/Fnr family transcriptional regulator [Marivita sp. GX14005]MCL3883285.1 Crp/Fnr family transcriptional regulator [Marivita sp. GX14005]